MYFLSNQWCMVFRELHRMTADDADVLRDFIRDTVADAHACGAVVGISGGIDSAVVTKLCADALGPDRVLAVFLPTDSTPIEDYRQTREMCQQWDVRYEVINIQPSVDALCGQLIKPGDNPLQRGNIVARCRMIALFDRAKREDALVFGTSNRSELLMGYMTKFGDGAEDATPMYDLYKTQVWEIAEIIGVPKEIIDKVPTAGLWDGQTDEKEMGITYRALDKALNVLEQGGSDEDMAEAADITEAKASELRATVRIMAHKRNIPAHPAVRVGGSA